MNAITFTLFSDDPSVNEKKVACSSGTKRSLESGETNTANIIYVVDSGSLCKLGLKQFGPLFNV